MRRYIRIISSIVSLLFIMGCSGTVLLIDNVHHSNDRCDELIADIEARGIFIQNSTGLSNVYYLSKVDTTNGCIGVAYFLEWTNEFPDFGRFYNANCIGLALQILAPLIYTNWLYIPLTGGLQRILYGKRDIEGIWAEYSYSNEKIDSLTTISFETPGHNPANISQADIALFSKDNIPFIKIASWSHLFEKPIQENPAGHFKPIPFPADKWGEYRMNNKRAEIAKISFCNFEGDSHPASRCMR